MKDFYIGGLVRTALFADSVCGLEVLSIGRAALERADCTLEIAGSQLLMRISVLGGWIWVAAGSLDEGGAPEPLFNLPDSPQGWSGARKFVRALENSRTQNFATAPD